MSHLKKIKRFLKSLTCLVTKPRAEISKRIISRSLQKTRDKFLSSLKRSDLYSRDDTKFVLAGNVSSIAIICLHVAGGYQVFLQKMASLVVEIQGVKIRHIYDNY